MLHDAARGACFRLPPVNSPKFRRPEGIKAGMIIEHLLVGFPMEGPLKMHSWSDVPEDALLLIGSGSYVSQ
jgi:hypothetical protein